ncbi:hypothetical protein HDE_05984 [Halotydeus destructor]|nr:hypothetical protein HDE_05984 [Halotydeus destructor]
MKSIAIIALALVAVVSASSDADYWIKQAKINAELDLDKFEPLIVALAQGQNDTAELVHQLQLLQAQIVDSDTNSQGLIPKIGGLVNQINALVQGHPNFLQIGAFKILIAVVDGQRDNKSYYLLDGAQNWVVLRVPALEAHPSDRVNKLKKELTNVQAATVDTRDTLDATAQKFVKAVKSLHALSSDFNKNLAEIQKIATGLKDLTPEGKNFLAKSADLVNKVKSVVSEFDA